MSEGKIQETPQKPEEQEIDLIELAQKVWAERKMLYKVCGIAAVIGLIVGFSIPKEYSTEVTLAPESASKMNAGSMGALAAMAGINLGGASAGEDALSPELYPDIVKSTPFLLELFDVKVKDQKEKSTRLYTLIWINTNVHHGWVLWYLRHSRLWGGHCLCLRINRRKKKEKSIRSV